MTKVINMTIETVAKELPANIVLDKWADVGFVWSGDVPVADFERLAQYICTDEQSDKAKNLTLTVQLQKQSGVLWLQFDVKGELLTPCQRCLETISVDVTGEYRLAILFNASQIETVQDAEYVLVDELNPHDGRKMLPIKDLLEDELLLVLPLSPRHESCDMPIEMVDEDEADDVAENPFAALAALKGKLN